VIYLDTGCLVKLYYPEPDSHLVALRVAGKVICYSPLHELEFTNALHQKAFHGSATTAQVQAAKALIAVDLNAGVLKRVSLDWEAVYQEAVTLAAQHTADIGCRSLDILHCAVAKAIGIIDFISTDGRQICLAEEMGLPYSPL
jgi:predicted nucleic acid-binding protein